MDELVYNWNELPDMQQEMVAEMHDETLRDGLQMSRVRQPSVDEKILMMEYISQLGIESVDVGYPASSKKNYNDVEEIIKYAISGKANIRISCAARSVNKDIEQIVDLSQKYSYPIDAYIFVGTSPIRQHVEGWDIGRVKDLTSNSISFATKHGLNACFVAEDSTRSNPEQLKQVYQTAIDSGAYRLCLCDTVGFSTPYGTTKLIKYVKKFLKENGHDVLLDWHGHNDRGLALANSLAAIHAGVNRVHATSLGIGERAGNTSMESLLVNLKMMKIREVNTMVLKNYCEFTSKICKYPIPDNQPIIGENAFRTGTGTHASAIIKALKANDVRLADGVYSSLSASEFGAEQVVEINAMSGRSSVRIILEKYDIDKKYTGEQLNKLIDYILLYAKDSEETTGYDKLIDIISQFNNEERKYSNK